MKGTAKEPARNRAIWGAFALAVLTAPALMTGCAKDESAAYRAQIEDCISSGHIQEDQLDSFMPPAQDFPIQVIEDSTFQQSQVGDVTPEIQAAVDQWNQYAQRTIGQSFFDLQTGPVPGSVESGDPRSCSDNGLAQSGLYLVNQTSTGVWSAMNLSSHTPGVTVRCYDSSHALKQQVTMVRQDLINPVQLQSVILHELGHALGLDHSCTQPPGAPASDDYRSCDGLPDDHPYRLAVMYPTLAVWLPDTGGPEVKNSLAPNDTARADCLFSQ